MEQDREDFNRHWETDKQTTEAAQHVYTINYYRNYNVFKKAELESKEKKNKEAEYKTLSHYFFSS